jgi:hypothetical protein
MNRYRAQIVTIILLAIGSASMFFYSCRQKTIEGIVFTRTTEKETFSDTNPEGDYKYIPHCQIVFTDSDKPGKTTVLTQDFNSARAPRISYDGKSMIFAAQLKENDTWQIWEMNLGNKKTRQLTSSKENCTDPEYLPGSRFVFSQSFSNDSLKAGHSLFTANLDGSNLKRITFNPTSYFSSNVLKDGRILAFSMQVYPDKMDPVLMVLRPDGTKADMFYNVTRENKLKSSAQETNDGRLIFIEADRTGKGNLISISYNRPLHSRVNLSNSIAGDFRAAAPLRSGKLLVSYRKSTSDRLALYEFDTESKTIGKAVISEPEYDILEVTEANPHERPRKLPSEVDMGVKSGLLLCQDINATGFTDGIALKEPAIEIVGLDSVLGVVDVADDGSFYLKVKADMPFQLRTIDNTGKAVYRMTNWIWLRPNERRGCTGCHQDPEMTPDNKVPLAVKLAPVGIPMHINKITEKKVSLE